EIRRKRKEKLSATRLTKVQNLDDRMEKLRMLGKIRGLKKAFYIKLVKEEAYKHGLNVEFASTKSFCSRLRINGYLTAISGTNTKTIYHQPKKGEPTVYYRFAVSLKPHDFSVFVLDQGENEYCFYIIPYEKIKELRLVTLRPDYANPRRKGRNGSKYIIYREAWHLFEKRQDEVK
ncbi:MAG: hypothetical protein ACPL6C_00970, partial [bacterium]